MSQESPIKNFRATDHAKLEMTRRQISEADIAQVLASPEHTETVRTGRRIYQSRVTWGKTVKTYLLRVIVDVDRQQPEIVSAYRTSKISKYWREKL